VQLVILAHSVQVRPLPWPSFYSYTTLVLRSKSLVVAGSILPKPPWWVVGLGNLFKVVGSCNRSKIVAGNIQSQCYMSGVVYHTIWLLVLFQYISTWRWFSTTHLHELRRINLAWEVDCVFTWSALGLHSVVHSSPDSATDGCFSTAVSMLEVTDADNGSRNCMNVKRTVEGFSNAGFAGTGIILEDWGSPRVCEQIQGRKVVSRDASVQHIEAVVDARHESGSNCFLHKLSGVQQMQQAITVKMANEQLRSGDEYISSTTWVMSDCDFLADLKILQTSALQLHAIEEVWDLLTPTEEVDVFSETNDQLLMVLSSSAGSSTKTTTTLQLQGHIQHQDSLVLIESGSSHIFLSDRLRSELSAVQPLVTPLTVQMASDQVITCCHHLPSNEWMMSGCYFSAARKFLLIPSFDLVVGTWQDWLQPHMSSSYNTSYQSVVGHTPIAREPKQFLSLSLGSWRSYEAQLGGKLYFKEWGMSATSRDLKASHTTSGNDGDQANLSQRRSSQERDRVS
jgi:hypothetical protein